MSYQKTVEVILPSELGYEKVAMAVAGSLAGCLGFSTARIEDLKTALSEAITNAIEHGNQLNHALNVLITIIVEVNALIVKVFDHAYQPCPALPVPRQDRSDYRGLGLFLIHTLVDEVKVQTRLGQNELQLVMYF